MTHTQGSLTPIESCRPQLRPARQAGWWRVVGPPGAEQDPALRRYPGVIDAPTPTPETWVPNSLVAAYPEKFQVVQHAGGAQAWAPMSDALRDYQRQCVEFATRSGHSAVYLGLDLGLGKTLTATSIAVAERYTRVLVTGPLIARGAWCGPRADPKKHYGIDVTPLKGRKDLSAAPDLLSKPGWFFCHYDILKAWMPWLLHFLRPECLIFDELDLCRGYKSRASRAARAIGRLSSVKRRIALSGTPVHNTVMDLWPQLDALEPEAWGKRHEFGIRYADGQQGEYGMVYGEPTYVHELQARLSQVYTYKSRRDVLHELPPVTRQRVEASLDEEVMEAYRAAEQNIRDYLERIGRGLTPGSPEALARVTSLMRLIGNAKVPTTVTAAKRALSREKKVVVFTWFRDTAKRIAKALGKASLPVVDGSVNATRRLELAAEFAQRESESAFIATMGAAGTSLNGLQAASVVILSELWWAPAKLLQAEGRVWRIGTPHGVLSQIICAADTIDEELLRALLTKADDIARTSRDKDAGHLIESLAEREPGNLDGFVTALEKYIVEWRSEP